MLSWYHIKWKVSVTTLTTTVDFMSRLISRHWDPNGPLLGLEYRLLHRACDLCASLVRSGRSGRLKGRSMVALVVQMWYTGYSDMAVAAIKFWTCSKQSHTGRRGDWFLKVSWNEAEGRQAHCLGCRMDAEWSDNGRKFSYLTKTVDVKNLFQIDPSATDGSTWNRFFKIWNRFFKIMEIVNVSGLWGSLFPQYSPHHCQHNWYFISSYFPRKTQFIRLNGEK